MNKSYHVPSIVISGSAPKNMTGVADVFQLDTLVGQLIVSAEVDFNLRPRAEGHQAWFRPKGSKLLRKAQLRRVIMDHWTEVSEKVRSFEFMNLNFLVEDDVEKDFKDNHPWLPGYLHAAYKRGVNPLPVLRKMMPGVWTYWEKMEVSSEAHEGNHSEGGWVGVSYAESEDAERLCVWRVSRKEWDTFPKPGAIHAEAVS